MLIDFQQSNIRSILERLTNNFIQYDWYFCSRSRASSFLTIEDQIAAACSQMWSVTNTNKVFISMHRMWMECQIHYSIR